ncbi:MAG TPA: energy-coupling factor transporter ATPase [Firmicutes bacterium]|jgi:energy-coupling factor transport system ATP-binding protein|nr:energy-coupling factor transporter ATPase [Bacillota bacterium]
MSVIIKGKDISYSYDFGNSAYALRNVDLSIAKGEFVYILGCNGSGKSTLVRHLNALLKLQHGALSVAGFDVANENDMWQLRRICGMVFQNPDNQFVSSVVEEDIAFGLENYEVPRTEIPAKVNAALQIVDMAGYEKRAPNSLSGGQKQRIALAGVFALDPEIIIFDEATAMLDPEGRREVLAMMRKLHDVGKTIIAITHYIEEAVHADSVILMHEGAAIASGKPQDILTDVQLLKQAEIMPPMPVRVYYDLLSLGIRLSSCPLTDEELAEKVCALRSKI